MSSWCKLRGGHSEGRNGLALEWAVEEWALSLNLTEMQALPGEREQRLYDTLLLGIHRARARGGSFAVSFDARERYSLRKTSFG